MLSLPYPSKICYYLFLIFNRPKYQRIIGVRRTSANEQFKAGIKNFVSGLPASKINSMAVAHRQLTMTNWKCWWRPIHAQLFTYFQKNLVFLQVSSHLKQIKSKKLDKWVPKELKDNQKNRRFEVSSPLLQRNKIDPFLDRILMCDEKWILYNNRRCSAQWLDVSEAKMHQKRSWSLFGGLQPVSSLTAS